MAIDESFITAMHVRTLHHEGIHAGVEPGVLFQSSTVAALLDGAYDGDVTFADLAEHGDLGLGTLDGLDGEMVAVDGRFFRADVDGRINEIDPGEGTPFAVVIPFEEVVGFEVEGPMDQGEVLAEADRRLSGDAGACALRIDGRFESVRARSVPRQTPPYRPLTEVVADQHVFEFTDVEGTLVGFRFPDHSDGIEITGYHLHFIDSARERGGHVLDFQVASGYVALDPSSQLRVELPPGVELSAEHLDLDEAVRRVEGG